MLGTPRLDGLTFLDIGSGSGLSSLAAMRLGAERVHSFDYDPDSVACTRELRRRFFPDSEGWTIEPGDALDAAYVEGLGKFDVVYSWGVLHHTGDLWRAMDNAIGRVGEGGRVWLALYNDRGWRSDVWRSIKRLYSRAPRTLGPLILVLAALPNVLRTTLYHLARGEFSSVFSRWTRTGQRGMSGWYDFVDWVGGYPFEVAKPEEVFEFCRERGLELTRLVTTNGDGNNEFVFVRPPVS